MDAQSAYKRALEFSKNTFIGLSHRYKKQTFLTDNDIAHDVATDCFERCLQKEMNERDLVIFCKYRTRQYYFLDRKHKITRCNMNEIPADSVVSKGGFYKSVESLKKIELVKKLTLCGLSNDEIMTKTGFARSTVCYLQKEGGVKCANSRQKYKKWQAEIIRICIEKMTRREIGVIFGWNERQVERCMRDFGIYSPQKGGRKKIVKWRRKNERGTNDGLRAED